MIKFSDIIKVPPPKEGRQRIAKRITGQITYIPGRGTHADKSKDARRRQK